MPKSTATNRLSCTISVTSAFDPARADNVVAMGNQVYYDDRAVFVNTTSGAKSLHHWIESAYMVVEAGLLKVKFISSTAVNW